MAQLPEGFVVDQPSGLPPGFVVDAPPAAAPPSEAPAVEPTKEERGFFAGVGEAFTGAERTTQQQRELPSLLEGGVLSGEDQAKVAAISPVLLATTNPNEIAQIISTQFPSVAVTYNLDAEGNPYPILTNRETGAVSQVNKPGLDAMDIMQGLGLAAAFTPAGRVPSVVGGGLSRKAAATAAASGLTSTAMEAAQAATGGEFDEAQIAIDTALGGLFEPAVALAKTTGRPVLEVFRSMAKRAGHSSDDIARAGDELAVSIGGQEQRVTPTVDLPAEGVERTARAAEEGVPISQAQASRDFAAQEAEQTLLASATPEGEMARQFEREQQEQLRAMLARESGDSNRLQQAIGEEPAISVSQQNEAIRQALTEAKELSGREVRDLYKQASDTAGGAIPLNNDLILDAADEAIVTMPTEPTVKDAIERALAKFGLIGEEVGKKGRNRTIIDDEGKTIEVLGDVTPLDLSNSESFRKELNKAVGADTTGAAKQVVRALDGVVEEAAGTIADPARKQAYDLARQAAASKAATFKSKDVVQRLTDYKPGTRTPQITTQDVINSVVKGKGSLDNTKAVLRAMAKYPGATASTAKRALSSETLGDIFSQAINKDTLKVSGQRLNSAIGKYDPETLKLILGQEGLSRLKKVQSIVGDATIPIPRTGNPSGTAYKLMNMLEKTGNFAGLGQMNFGSLAVGAVKKGKELKDRKQTLQNLTQNKLKELTGEGTPKSKALEQFARLSAMLELREQETQRQQEQQATNKTP